MAEKISAVFPVFNEKENLNALYQQVKDACSHAGTDYEMIFVDDGSSDDSLEIIKSLRKKDPKVKFISLSRNFGHQNAIFAGMTRCSGDAVITMDADLQHPPSLIPKMIEMWRNGAEVVCTIKKSYDINFVKKVIIKTAYWFISKISGLKLSFGQSDFKLLDRKVLKVMLNMPEYHKFLRGQVKWIGFRQEALPYDVQKRYGGKAKFNYKSLYNLALAGIFSFGRYPLHLIMLFSFLIMFLCSLYIFFILAMWILKWLHLSDWPFPPGWTDLIVIMMFLNSMQLIFLGLTGEYIGRIYDQAKNRPVFIVRESSDE